MTAGALALAVAASGPIAWAQDAEPAPTTTTEPASTTSAEAPTGTATTEPTTTTTPTTGPAEESETSEPTPTVGTTESAGTTEPDARQDDPKAETPVEVDAQAAPPAAQPDLRVSIAFDQAVYQPESDVGFTVTVRNVGTAPAVDVRWWDSGSLWLKSGAAELHRLPGPTLAPGESRTYRLVGRQNDARASAMYYTVQARTGLQETPLADPTPNDNYATATATVPQHRGSAAGLVYRDADRDGRFDDGEGVADLPVYAVGGTPWTTLTGRTDAAGRFTFGGDVPTGAYRAYLQSFPDPGGVIAAGRASFTVEAGVAANLEFPLAPPVSEVLRPLVEFDRDTYRPTDPITIRVTLTNSGSAPLANVVAVCDEVRSDGSLDGRSPAWAELSPEGPGVTLAAGETRVFTVVDAVPEAAVLSGQVHVACNFGNSGRASAGYRGSSDYAEVGAFGAVEGALALDRGDGAQPLDGVRLLALDRRTGLAVAEAVSHDGGSFGFPRLREGVTKVLVLGDYRDKATGAGWFTADVVADGTTRVAFVAEPGPTVTEPTPRVDLVVTASFDKAAYAVDELVTAKVKVTNAGVGYRSELRYTQDYATSFTYDMGQWGLLDPTYRPGSGYPRALYLWPGESYEVTLVGHAPAWRADGVVRLKGWVNGGSGGSQPIDLSAAVAYPRGDATVVVYGDRDADGSFDGGEALQDVDVDLSGGLSGNGWHSGRTDADGRFRVEGIGVGNYSVYTWHPDGWIPAEDTAKHLTVTADGDTAVELRLVRPVSDGLTAELAFDRESYLPTDQPKLKLDITNDTGSDLTVAAHCGGYGWPHEIANTAEWGPLAQGGPGVLVAKGTTFTTEVVETMPAASPDHGLITASCVIGPRDAYGNIVNGSPFANARAKVPGATWTTTGRVEVQGDAYPRAPLPNVKLVLLDPATGLPAARATTDADGRFTFPDLPVGHYTPVVVGPWKVVDGQLPRFAAVRGNPYPELVVVEPGPEVADPDTAAGPPGSPGSPGSPDPVNPAAPAAGASGPTDALATTGASVLGLGLLGVLLLAFGIGARTLGRRPA